MTHMIPRIKGPAAQLLRGLLLLVALGCSQQESEPPRVSTTDSGSLEKQVEAIQREVKRVDAANDAPESVERRRLTVDLPHWRFFGLFQKSNAMFLSALFSQGRFVREETYYLFEGKPLLVKVERWWDVDDPSRAPEPATREDFYIDADRMIRHVMEVASSPPTVRTSNTTGSAAALVERSRSIAKILLAGIGDPAATRSLEAFPSVDPLRR